MTLTVHEVDSLESVSRLEHDWNALAERTPTTSVFSTFEWQSSWWRHYGRCGELRVLVACEGPRVVGILPLYLRRVSVAPLVRARELRLIGSGGDTSPDYLGLLCEPEFENAVATALTDRLALEDRSWDVLRLTDMRPGALLLALHARLGSSGSRVRLARRHLIHLIALPASYSEYLAGMPGERRRKVGNLRRSALSKLQATFVPELTSAELGGVTEELIALHRARWDSKAAASGAFRSASYKCFHREVMARCHEKGWLRLYRIVAHGRSLAIYYCYRYRDEVLFFQTGFDPQLAQHRLGQVLMGLAVEQAIREGASVFDMLKGDYAYKGLWSNAMRCTLDLEAFNTSAAGRVALLRRSLGAIRSRVQAGRPTAQGDGTHPVR